MHFSKLPTTIDQQLDLLSERGMDVGSTSAARQWLETVGYYRLSAYWLPFEQPAPTGSARSKAFVNGTTFSQVTELYVFDRKLRVLVLEAIERVEVHVRSRWTYYMSHNHGAHAHLDHRLYQGGLNHAEQLVRLARSVDKSEETFIQHYKSKYSEPYSPPLWAATELMTFGELSKWVQATKDNTIKSKLGHDLGLPTKEVVESVLQLLSYVRNICAHHGRLWNRRTVKRLPKIKRFKDDLLYLRDATGREVADNSVYNVLVVLVHLMERQGTDSTFRNRLIDLLLAPPRRKLGPMGFPDDWVSRPVWSS